MTPLPPQGFVLLPKTECDVREVEFARCLRLRQTSLEPVAFRLPRVRVRMGAQYANTQPLSGALGLEWPCPKTAPLTTFWGTCSLTLLRFRNSQELQTGAPPNACQSALGLWSVPLGSLFLPPCRKNSSRMMCSQTQP